ncbi:EAL domain-containing protein [Porticoccaceae bacterium]|nr:EAL domain-containing protein [Porticoccaceae bacterium]
MPSVAIFRLLLTAASADEANHFVSILRSANYTVDAKLATQEHELQALLAKPWDLVISLQSHLLLTPPLVRQNLLRAQLNVPMIIISELGDQQSIAEGLRLGASEVVARDHDQHLLLAVERSQNMAAAARELNHCRQQLQQLGHQQRNLLSSWPTPLLIIVEGVVRLCNSAAARMLRCNTSELLDLPLLDRLERRSAQQLRPLLLGTLSNQKFPIQHLQFIDSRGEMISKRVNLSAIWFEDSQALQITVEARLRPELELTRQTQAPANTQPEQSEAALEKPDGDGIVDIEERIAQRTVQLRYRPFATLIGEQRHLYQVEPALTETPNNLSLHSLSGDQRQRLDHWLCISALKEIAKITSAQQNIEVLLPLSAASANDSRFIPWLKTQLRDQSLEHLRLTLTVRESDLIRHIDKFLATAIQLEALSINLAVSHFGVALNPLALLDALHPSLLLLDQQITESLLDTNHSNHSDALDLAHALDTLGIATAADNIGSAHALPMLWRSGIGYIAGDYVGPAQNSLLS